jgi:hypothetical protein
MTAAQLRRLLAFETRMQVDAFLKEHKIYDSRLRTSGKIAKCFVNSG